MPNLVCNGFISITFFGNYRHIPAIVSTSSLKSNYFVLLGFYIVTVNGDGNTKVYKEEKHIAFLIMILIPGVTLSSQQFVNILKVIKDIL